MKNIKLIVAIAITFISIFGNFSFGYAGITLPATAAPVADGVLVTSSDDLDSRASVSNTPATLQYIVKFRSTRSTNSISKSSALNQNTAQAAISQISGKVAQIDAAMSGQTFLMTFADQTQVNALLNHTTTSEQSKLAAATSNSNDLEIEYMVPNLRRQITLTPDDTYFESQIQYQPSTNSSFSANLAQAWDITTGSTNVVIAVLDTGIRFEHPDLAGRLLPGYDFVSTADMGNDGDGRDADPSDPGDWVTAEESAQVDGSFYKCSAVTSHWHGTHVAGIIGAQGNNEYGVAGANWLSKILPVRVLGKCGGYDTDIIDAIRWAAGLDVPGVPANTTPARIINMSLGGSGACNAAYQDAINEVTAAGVIVVAAAGNQRGDANNFTPANCNNVISVGSVSKLGNRASYANAGSSVMISSPGGDAGAVPGDGVLSTVDLGTTVPMSSGFKMLNGTSMAAAQVSGIVSLLVSAKPSLTPEAVRAVLSSTVTAFPTTSSCTTALCGAGIINALAALQTVTQQYGTPQAPIPTPTPVEAVKVHTLFLPMVGNNMVASNTAQHPVSVVAVNNGGFEQGAGDWQMTSSIGLVNLILSKDQLPADRTPRSGDWMAWLGGMNDETSSISQQVTVPAEPTYLVFWKRVKSVETDCAHDTAQVLINNQPVQSVLLCTTSASTTWSHVAVDLSTFAGQTVELKFQVSTDSMDSSSLYLDDLTFQSK